MVPRVHSVPIIRFPLFLIRDGASLLSSMALGSYGWMPHFAKTDLIFEIEKARSNGVFTTLAKSRLETMKFFLAKERALAALLKTSRG